MSRLPLPDHAEMLECRPSRQAGLQVPQSPHGQQLLRAGLTAHQPPAVHAHRHRGAAKLVLHGEETLLENWQHFFLQDFYNRFI